MSFLCLLTAFQNRYIYMETFIYEMHENFSLYKSKNKNKQAIKPKVVENRCATGQSEEKE